ncbi:putative tetratricopeptide repeat-containing domain protein [Eubacterium sp. CAG:603]|nr:putative tetratricopeptide repeat-containing domain protein [Eubacterium sp. CAG:603]
MDKYEYNVKSDQIKKLYSRKEFEAAAKIADEIDWYRVKDNTMINRVADIYENTKQYEKAKEVLLIAYERSPLGRQLAYKLTILALRTKNFVEADEFYQDFVEMSPSDVSQYLLKYRIAKAKGEDIEVLIKILEAYIEVEMDERWQYELAKLYHEAGEDDKCIAMCDELELWFNDGKYVDKARELKKLITGVLTEYNKRYAKDNVAKSNIASSNIVSTEDSKNITSVSNGESDNLEVNAPNVNAGSIDEYDEDSEDDTQADNWNQVDALGRERVSKVNEESDEDEEAESEDHTGMRSLAEAIVAGKEERKTSKYNKKKDDEEVLEDNLELLDDNISDDDDEYLDDEISAEDEARANANAAAKEVARRAEEAEKNIPKLTAEEIAANEALKAAEAAALEAQRAADLARQLVMEAKLRAEQVKGTSGTPSDKYKGMTADEISKSLESEDMLSGNSDLKKKDSMIEIFEFDKDKEGKVSNIGEELTKTAEIDIDEINIRLADENNLYNTANIQAALAKSMEKLMNDEKKVRNAFEMQIDDDNDEIRPTIEDDDNNEIRPAIEDDDSYLDDDDEDVYDDSADTTENVKESENVSEVEEVEESEIINEPENVIETENTPETAEENSATENTVNVEEIKETESIPEVETVEGAKDIPEVETVEEAKDIPEAETAEEAKDIPEVETVEEAKDIPEVETIVESDEYSKVNEESAPIEEIRNSEETEEVKSVETVSDEDEIEDDLIDEPTKRIDRAEINRILNASKNIYQSLPKSVFENTEEEVETKVEMTKPEEDDQIEGQMTLEEVLAEFKDNEADKTNDNEADELKENANETPEEATENADETIDEVSENANETSEEATDKSSVASAGFVVKNHRIPKEYRSLFNDFVGTGSMEEKIADTLDNLINKFVMDGTSKTNNVIITGSAKIGKTTLGLSLIKAANRGRNRSGRKVAKVKASVLNKRGVALAMTQILGTDLIIEQAGNLMPNTIVDLMIAMKNYTEEMLIVLEDDKAAIDRMLDNSPDLKGFFSNRLDIHEMEIDDMVKIAKDYAEEQFYIIDEMGELALYAKLDDISGRNPVLSIEDIQEVIDDAIAHANRFSLGKIFGRIHKNKDDMRVLSEQDFL